MPATSDFVFGYTLRISCGAFWGGCGSPPRDRPATAPELASAMTWKPESVIWICSECQTLYSIPNDVDALATSVCCAAMFRLDSQQHQEREALDDSADEFWR